MISFAPDRISDASVWGIMKKRKEGIILEIVIKIDSVPVNEKREKGALKGKLKHIIFELNREGVGKETLKRIPDFKEIVEDVWDLLYAGPGFKDDTDDPDNVLFWDS